MSFNEYGVFSIFVFLFLLAFKVVFFIASCFFATIGTSLNLMVADDMARSLDRWHDTF